MKDRRTSIETYSIQRPSIRSAVALMESISEETDGLAVASDLKTQLAAGCHFAALDHHAGIALLFSSGLYSPALALMRPLFEAYIRGIWLSDCATESQVSDFVSGNWKKTSNIGSMIARLEKTKTFGTGVLEKSKIANWETLCGFTHTGIQQVQMCLSRNAVERSCSDQEIDEALNFAGACAVMAGIATASLANNKEAASRIFHIGKEFVGA